MHFKLPTTLLALFSVTQCCRTAAPTSTEFLQYIHAENTAKERLIKVQDNYLHNLVQLERGTGGSLKKLQLINQVLYEENQYH